MTEPRLVLKIKKALQAEGHYVVKIHGGRYSAGVSDLLVCVELGGQAGAFVALEVKLPGKEKNVTELQAKELRSVREAGGIAWVISSVEAAVEICDKLPYAHAGMELVYECD
jgi:hypothetical protein